MGQQIRPDVGEHPEKRAVALTVACTAALTLLLLASSTYFRGVSASFVGVADLPRSLTSLFCCACFALLAAASYLRPQSLLSRSAAGGGARRGLGATLIGAGYACTSAVPFHSAQFLHELLACGRNARFITENLGVTRNTAKAHIGHIYTKLGVHSHQEPLSLIEGSGEKGDSPRNR